MLSHLCREERHYFSEGGKAIPFAFEFMMDIFIRTCQHVCKLLEGIFQWLKQLFGFS